MHHPTIKQHNIYTHRVAALINNNNNQQLYCLLIISTHTTLQRNHISSPFNIKIRHKYTKSLIIHELTTKSCNIYTYRVDIIISNNTNQLLYYLLFNSFHNPLQRNLIPSPINLYTRHYILIHKSRQPNNSHIQIDTPSCSQTSYLHSSIIRSSYFIITAHSSQRRTQQQRQRKSHVIFRDIQHHQ